MNKRIGLYELAISETSGKIKLTYLKATRFEDKKVYSFDEIIDILDESVGIRTLRTEHSYIITVNNAGYVTGVGLIGVGSPEDSPCPTTSIGSFLLLLEADQFVIVHNHPSGICKPSKADISLTKSIMKLAELLDVRFVDHVVITREAWYAINNKCICDDSENFKSQITTKPSLVYDLLKGVKIC